MNEKLIGELLALTDEQFDLLVATVSAARRIVAAPRKPGRPPGKRSKKTPVTAQPALPGVAASG